MNRWALEHNQKNTEFYVHILPCRGGLWRSDQIKYFFSNSWRKKKTKSFLKIEICQNWSPVEFFVNSCFLALFQHLKNCNECCRAHNELKIGGRPYFGMYFHKKNRLKNWRTPRTAFLKSWQELPIYMMAVPAKGIRDLDFFPLSCSRKLSLNNGPRARDAAAAARAWQRGFIDRLGFVHDFQSATARLGRDFFPSLGSLRTSLQRARSTI